MRKNKPIPGDDGRRIANMNVEGLPWYSKPREEKPDAPRQEETGQKPEELPPPSARDTFRYMMGALAAAFAVGLVFIIVFGLFIFFCVKVWFA